MRVEHVWDVCVREEKVHDEVHSCAFYVTRSSRKEAQTGLRTAVGVMCSGIILLWVLKNEETAEKAREKEPRGRARHQAPSCGHMLHCKQTVPTRCPSTLHSFNLSIWPTGQRTEGSKQQCHLYRPCSSRVALVNWRPYCALKC